MLDQYPIAFAIIVAGLGLAFWGASRIVRARYSIRESPEVPGRSGLVVASHMLKQAGVIDVGIVAVRGPLADYYDATRRTLRLSERTYHGQSPACLAWAAHEAGHALQAERYPWPLRSRAYLVPITGITASASGLLLVCGLILPWGGLIVAGLLLFSASILGLSITLPLEIDASRRARKALIEGEILSPEERAMIGPLLDAAAWSHFPGRSLLSSRLSQSRRPGSAPPDAQRLFK